MKFNKQLKKYQPLIQTIGIVILLFALMASLWQNQILRKELKLQYDIAQNELIPRFRATIEYSEHNSVVDNFIFRSLSNSNILQKEEVIIVNNSTPIIYETYNGKINTNFLKRELFKILNRYYLIDSDHGFVKSMGKMSYPIAVKYTFENFGILQDTVILYEYQFTPYFNSTNNKIKSEGLEFKKYIPDIPETIVSELIKYNINSSLLSNIPTSIFDIKEEIIMKDTLLAPILKFINLNLTFTKYNFVIDDTNNKGIFFLLPYHYNDEKSLQNRNELVTKILSYKEHLDRDIGEALEQVFDFEKNFFSMKSSVPLDSIHINSSKQIDINEINMWYDKNSKLKSLILNKIKI